MAQIGVQPIQLKNALFTVETDSYEKHVSAVEFVPSSNLVTWKGLHPTSVFTFGSTATWQCNLTFAQDWETPDSLSQYLFENDGEEIDVVFEPVNGGAGFSATLIVTPGSIGGALDSVAVSTFTLGVKGKPVLIPAA